MKIKLIIAAVALVLVVGVTAIVLVDRNDSDLMPRMGATEMDDTSTNKTDMPGMDMGSGNETSGGAPPALSSLPETPILSPTQMGGLVMPPGMIVTQDTSMEAMTAMAAVDLKQVSYRAPADARGDQPLASTLVDGVKEFRLETSLIEWNILPDARVAAYAFNRQVPGPRIRATEGDRVRIVVTNRLPEPTSVHWHGLILPNAMDGAAGVTQKPIAPGQSFTYEFTLEQAGTFFYHSHQQADRQQSLGLYGAFIIDPKLPPPASYDKELVIQLQEWTFVEGYTFPSMEQVGLLPNFFTINGKAYPETETITVKQGEKLLIRFIGSQSGVVHPMHIHGGPFTIVATDGNPVPATAQIQKDTIAVSPGERWDVVWTAQRKGKWLLHCHVLHHLTNDDVETKGGGGLTMVINVV